MKLKRAIAGIVGAALLAAVTSAFADPVAYRLRVDGLSCPFCVYGIEKKLRALAGVERVEAHIKEGVIVVRMRDGAVLDEATARQAVREAGFTLDDFGQIASGDAR